MDEFDSGSSAYTPGEESALAVLHAAAKDLALPLKTSSREIFQALDSMMQQYGADCSYGVGVESGPVAKQALQSIEIQAKELASLIRRLKQGAIEKMIREISPCQASKDSIISGLPSRGPQSREWGGSSFHFSLVDDGQTEAGRWVVNLEALAALACAASERIAKEIRKGGRISFADRLYGSPRDALARACREFAEAHGCRTSAVVLKMVQAVMEAEGGSSQLCRKSDGRRSPDIGRKAVRKLV